MFFDITDSMRIPEVENQVWIEKAAKEIQLCRGILLGKANVSLEFRGPLLNLGDLRGISHGILRVEAAADGMSVLYYRLALAPTRYLLLLFAFGGVLGGLQDGLRPDTLCSLLVGITFGCLLYFLARLSASSAFRRLVRRTLPGVQAWRRVRSAESELE